MKNHVLVLDVGTTGIKGIVFDGDLNIVSRAYVPLKKNVKNGRVEQVPREILAASKRVLQNAVKASKLGSRDFLGIGITNQRETTILWDRENGQPVYPAIVWEDARTKNFCAELPPRIKKQIREKTGLAADPYFSASKIRWILKNIPHAARLAEKKKLLFGTVDSWLLWNLVEGNPHMTDYTNASRTLVFNIKERHWDDGLLDIFEIPKLVLPSVQPSAHRFGLLKKDVLGFALPILAVSGDQESSLFAAGTKKGTTKVTYGTGAFVGQVIGTQFAVKAPFFTTLAAFVDRPVYMVESKIDDCGREVQDALGNDAAMKKVVRRITRKAAGYLKRLPIPPKTVIVDGGVTQYAPLVGFQEKASGMPAKRQAIYDGTALGAAMLARTHFEISR